jgi:Major Facilitator Superfamily
MRRNAMLFVAISLVSGFGSTAMALVAGVWILDLTGSAGLAGLAGLCVYAPTLAAPWLGMIVDRVPRRPLLIGADLALAGTLLSLFAVRSRAEVWLIFVVMLAYGITYVLLDAGETALLPAAVPAGLLGDVNGWRSSAQEGMKLVAPLAGAALYAWHGGAPVAALSAAMPALAALLYALVCPYNPLASPAAAGTALAADERTVDPPDPATAGPATAIDGRTVGSPRFSAPARVVPPSNVPAGDAPRGGVPAGAVPSGGAPGWGRAARWVPAGDPVAASRAGESHSALAGLGVIWREPAIRIPVLVAAVAIAMSGFTTPALYSAVTVRAGLPSAFVGVLASAQGAGSIAGGLPAGRLLARTGTRAVAGLGATLFALGTLSRCLTWPPGLVAGSVLIGVGLPWTLVAGITAIQTYTPDALLGRVSATANTAMFGPIAAFIPLGALAVRTGSVPLNVAATVVCLATAALALLYPAIPPHDAVSSQPPVQSQPADGSRPLSRRSWTHGTSQKPPITTNQGATSPRST